MAITVAIRAKILEPCLKFGKFKALVRSRTVKVQNKLKKIRKNKYLLEIITKMRI